MMQGWYCVKSLTGQWHDRVRTEPTFATVDSCFDLVWSHQYGIASYGVFSWSTDIHILTEMVMTSDETQIQIICQLANVTCKARDKGQLEKYRISCHCGVKESADRHKLSRRKIMAKPCKKWAAYRIWKDLRPQKNTRQWDMMMQRMQRTFAHIFLFLEQSSNQASLNS